MINFTLRPGDRFRNLIEIIDPNDNILPEKTNQLRLTMDKKTGEIYVVKYLLIHSIERINFNDDKFSALLLTTKAVKSLNSWFTGILGEFAERVNLIDFIDYHTVHKFIKELNITTILKVPIRLTSSTGFDHSESVYQIIPEAEKELLENYMSIPDLNPGARYFYKTPQSLIYDN